jgi:hypothetical protein
MARLNRVLAAPAPAPSHATKETTNDLDLSEFEAEMKRLSAVNQELLQQAHAAEKPAPAPPKAAEAAVDSEELETSGSGQTEKVWRERQREYEMLLEEKSEVIRGLHQKLQEAEESVNLAGGPAPTPSVSNISRVGQAEEILNLKREMEEQRKQLDQDEQDMMAQMRQMEMQMAKERAEMARQRQEVARLQAELTREIENASRDPQLKERLKGLRRSETKASLPAPSAAAAEKTDQPAEQKSSGFFRRIFG